jgi:hypothetical protein
MKKILSIILLVFLTAGVTRAQEPTAIGFAPTSYYTFGWNTTFPLGDFSKWVEQISPAGFDFGGRYQVKDGLYAGFNIGWQRVTKLYEDQTFTIPKKGLAITAENYRFTWMVPFQGTIGYHFFPEKLISPFVGLGIGGDYMEHHLMIQEYDIYETFWDFSLTPEIGALAKFGKYSDWGALVSFNYKWTTNKIEIYNTTSDNLQMLNLKVGITYLIR